MQQGGWAVPGAISAASISAPLQTSTPAYPLGTVATSAPSHVPSNALLPLSYWYGHAEMRRNPLLLDRLIRNLGENIRDRWENDMIGIFKPTFMTEIRMLKDIVVTQAGHQG